MTEQIQLSSVYIFLAYIYKHTEDKKLLSALKKSLDFIIWFLQPDGNCGGEYASRGTKFFFPAGFEMLSAVDDNSSIIAKNGKKFHK